MCGLISVNMFICVLFELKHVCMCGGKVSVFVETCLSSYQHVYTRNLHSVCMCSLQLVTVYLQNQQVCLFKPTCCEGNTVPTTRACLCCVGEYIVLMSINLCVYLWGIKD